MLIGDRVRKRRVTLGLTQDALAARVGVCVSTVCSWETGARCPGLVNLDRLAAALGVGPAWLIGRRREAAQ